MERERAQQADKMHSSKPPPGFPVVVQHNWEGFRVFRHSSDADRGQKK